MKKKIIIIVSSLLLLLISFFAFQAYKNKQEEQRRVEEEKKYNDLLTREYRYYQDYMKQKKNLNIKKIIGCSGNYVLLTEEGDLYVRISEHSQFELKDSFDDYLLLDAEKLEFEITDIESIVKEGSYNTFIISTNEDKQYLVNISDKADRYKDYDYVTEFETYKNKVYTYIIDLELQYGITNINKIQYDDSFGSGGILTNDGELYTFGTGYDGLLGLGIEKDSNQLLPEKVIDNYGTIQGNIKQVELKTPSKPGGKLSVLTNDGELYVSGMYLAESVLDYHRKHAHNKYSVYLTYVKEIEEIQGKIEYIESDSYFDLIKTKDGKLYYFGIDPKLVYKEIEEVDLVFHELKHNGESIDAKEIRCTKSFIVNGCGILTDDDLLVYGVTDGFDGNEIYVNIHLDSYTNKKLSKIPSSLDYILVDEVMIDNDGEWIGLDSVYDWSTMKIKRTFDEYLNERPVKFYKVKIEDLLAKLEK